jgi:glycosyltransferase involved in cell wall biosynthesis
LPRSDVVANRVLVVTLDAYRFATRSRKAAIQYLSVSPTTYLGLSRAGRTGRWDKSGNFVADGLDVRQVYVRRPWVAPTRRSQIHNLILCYLPALARMAQVVLRTPAEVVHVTGAPLALLGLLHRVRFGSRMVLDINERPGAVVVKGSLTSIFSRIELSFLRYASKRVDVATVVTHGDVEAVSALGFRTVALVRNAPLSNWRAPYTPPPNVDGGGLAVVVIGSIFEGRGYEILLRALAKAKHHRDIRLKIYGPGREDYLASLKSLAEALDITDRVKWMGRTDSSGVSAAYLSAQVGLVLYEADDPGNDGLSNKILECVSTGRPVIAGDLSENRRFVTANGVGWLTDVNVDALADALRSAGVGEDIAAIGAKCRQYGDTWLNWESEFSKVLSMVAPRQSKSP